MPFSDYCGGKWLANCAKCCLQRKNKLPFHSGTNRLTFGFEHSHKTKGRSLTFLFLRSTPRSFSFLFHSPPHCWPFTGLHEVKIYQTTLMKKVKFFNKKWQVVARPEFPSICKSNLIGFLHVNLAQFMRSLSFGHFLKDFFLLLESVMKEIIYRKRNE